MAGRDCARQASGWALAASDVAQLKALLQLVAQAPVRLATVVDPSWDYTYDLAGRVVEERAQIPAAVAVVNGQPVNLGPLEQTYCYRYDDLGRMVGVEHLARYGLGVSPVPYVDPCDDMGRSQLAAYRYDVDNKRDYAKVMGQESWQLRGPGGEVLAEVDSTGGLMRAFIYADGEPLALVQRTAGITTRPPTSGGCSSAPGGAFAVGALLLVLMAGRRRRGAYVLLVVVAVAVLPACGNNESKQRIGVKRGALPANPEILYFHNDALGTPRVLTNSAGAVVWRAEYRPFGELQVLEADADGDGTSVEQPLRFPGQYDDALGAFLMHQGTYENWNRHYSPFTGTYLSPEPMLQSPLWLTGVARHGTIPLPFGYANSNPIRYSDSTGALGGADDVVEGGGAVLSGSMIVFLSVGSTLIAYCALSNSCPSLTPTDWYTSTPTTAPGEGLKPQAQDETVPEGDCKPQSKNQRRRDCKLEFLTRIAACIVNYREPGDISQCYIQAWWDYQYCVGRPQEPRRPPFYPPGIPKPPPYAP